MVSKNLFGLFAIALICNQVVDAYDWGPQLTACDLMQPKLDKDAMEMNDEYYYRISPSSDTFYPGQKLYVRVKGTTSDDRYTYNGVLMAVKVDSTVGTWDEFHHKKYNRIACGGKNDSAVIEASNHPKIVGDDVFVWNAPNSCDFDHPFYDLTATVVKNDKEYIPALGTLLRCVPAPTVPEMEVRDACKENYAVLPNGTSFEDGYGGWWNEPMTPMRWTRHMGPTPSHATGPQKAFHGEWYVYTEASYPAKKGDIAELNSPVGLAGCFCVRLKCHMFVGQGVRFEFLINGELGFSHSNSEDRWINAYASVNVPGQVQIKLRLIRGDDFRGDLAMDDISIKRGMCSEDLRP